MDGLSGGKKGGLARFKNSDQGRVASWVDPIACVASPGERGPASTGTATYAAPSYVVVKTASQLRFHFSAACIAPSLLPS